MNAQSRHEFQKQLFEAIEFRLEIAPVSASKSPPIILDVRKGMGGTTGYRPLWLPDIEDASLVRDFKSLKISVHLPLDTIILELALSQKNHQDDSTAEIEQPIGTYLIRDGETVALSELAQFGLAPMVAKALHVTAQDVPQDQIPLVNHTTGLQISSIRKKANVQFVTLKNVSAQTICKYSIGVENPLGGSRHTSYRELPAGTEDSSLFHLPPQTFLTPTQGAQILPEQQTFVIGALMYADKTCEGKESWLYHLLLLASSPDSHLRDFVPSLLQKLHEAPDSQLAFEVGQLRKEISTRLGEEKALLSGVKIVGKDWTEEEIVERLVIGSLRDSLAKSARAMEWSRTHNPRVIDSTRQEILDKQITRNQTILSLLQVQ